ncbi:MAG: type III-B CRISPR-associated protein Cas10/Cmr2 [Methylococcaceae bacterium]
MTRYFHFTLGPVQGFVAEARRTRDFWAGSFLLSYLAGVAMLEVQHQKGTIIFPVPDKNFLTWIQQGNGTDEAPRHGGIPNRFMAEVSEGFQPSKVEKAVKKAWNQIAEAVWENDFSPEYNNTPTRVIWERQINGFWDMAGALVDQADATGLLDRRKNWRSHYLQPEPGQKCMMMQGMQELSGSDRAGEAKPFWDTLRERTGETDLRDNERLCAIAYVKRRLLQGFNKKFAARMPDDRWTAHGWELPGNVPAVTFLAAAPWLVQAINTNPKAVETFYKSARTLAQQGEWNTQLKCLQECTADNQRWTAVDGPVFFEAELRNKKLYDPQKAEQVLKALSELRRSTKPPLGVPSPYYALLLMDGDSLGKQMSQPTRRELISHALNDFTGSVQAIVEQQHSGFLVYAGGDDVLALLILDDALSCANALRQRYEAAFNKQFEKQPEERFAATLSAAIEYAHYRLPFTKILADAHELLDDHAKDGCGRDAVAVRVWKQSGLHLTYAQPWAIAMQQGNSMQDMVDILRPQQENNETPLAGSFFYRLRDLFQLLNHDSTVEVGDEYKVDMAKLLRYEYLHSGLHETPPSADSTRGFIELLMTQCQQRQRTIADDLKSVISKTRQFNADAGLLARFLANRGLERH